MALRDIINKKDAGNFILSPLPYTDDHLEPFIGSSTVRFHYCKHLASYIDKVNSLKGDYPTDATIEEMIKNEVSDSPLYRNASQVFNHYFYFEQLNPAGVRIPMAGMNFMIRHSLYGDFGTLSNELAKTALDLFGSGWVFLVKKSNGDLGIRSYTGTGTPTEERPLLAIDVWEHAYYLDYKNNRQGYVNAFFELADWSVVERRLQT